MKAAPTSASAAEAMTGPMRAQLAWLEFGWVCAEEVVPSGAGFGFGLAEVLGVRVGPVNHVAGVEADLGIGMGFCIVEEATAGSEGCLGFFGLGRCNGAEGD